MPRRAKSAPKQKATATSLANETPLVARASQTAGDVLDRIKKCLDRAKHVDANESEARAAMKIATRLMSQHSVTQAELIDNENDNERDRRGGLSLVKITPSREGGHAINSTWANDLVDAVTQLFDCDAYCNQSYECLEWTFYGIAEHTVFAAMSFEMVHNLILDWADAFTTVQGRNSYCLGCADGLHLLAEEERLSIENTARRNEQKAMAARMREEELERQKAPAPLNDQGLSQPTEESSGDSDYERYNANVHTNSGSNDDSDDETLIANANYLEQDSGSMPELTGVLETDMAAVMREEVKSELKQKQMKQERLKQHDDEDMDLSALNNVASSPQPNIRTEVPMKLQNERKSSLQWSSTTQLVRFRENTVAIEEGVLRAQGIKLRNRPERASSVKDYEAYEQGIRDSKRINMRVATIEEGRSST